MGIGKNVCNNIEIHNYCNMKQNIDKNIATSLVFIRKYLLQVIIVEDDFVQPIFL